MIYALGSLCCDFISFLMIIDDFVEGNPSFSHELFKQIARSMIISTQGKVFVQLPRSLSHIFVFPEGWGVYFLVLRHCQSSIKCGSAMIQS